MPNQSDRTDWHFFVGPFRNRWLLRDCVGAVTDLLDHDSRIDSLAENCHIGSFATLDRTKNVTVVARMVASVLQHVTTID